MSYTKPQFAFYHYCSTLSKISYKTSMLFVYFWISPTMHLRCIHVAESIINLFFCCCWWSWLLICLLSSLLPMARWTNSKRAERENVFPLWKPLPTHKDLAYCHDLLWMKTPWALDPSWMVSWPLQVVFLWLYVNWLLASKRQCTGRQKGVTLVFHSPCFALVSCFGKGCVSYLASASTR